MRSEPSGLCRDEARVDRQSRAAQLDAEAAAIGLLRPVRVRRLPLRRVEHGRHVREDGIRAVLKHDLAIERREAVAIRGDVIRCELVPVERPKLHRVALHALRLVNTEVALEVHCGALAGDVSREIAAVCARRDAEARKDLAERGRRDKQYDDQNAHEHD